MAIDSALRKALLQPRCVALVGASSDLMKNNSRPQRFLKRFGYSGRVLPINPSRTEVLGERAYPDLKSAPGPIDHAFIMLPAAAVPAVIDDCCELRIPVATLFSAGFAELGEEGLKRQREMVTKARAGGVRLLAMGRSEGGRYSAILSALLASDHTDAVVSVIGSSAQNPQIIVDRVLHAEPRGAKPLGVFLAPRADDALVQLQRNGVASFRTPESCADAVHAYLDWKAPGERPPAPAEAGAASAVVKRLTERLTGERRNGEQLSERDAGELFAALGIRVAAHRTLSDGSGRVDLPGPYAVKLLSPDILHKTEAGMVRLDVAHDGLADAAKRMLDDARTRFPEARVEGVLVQQMEHGLAEVIVGYRLDPEVGPVLVLGMGGVAAELRNNISVRIAPVTLETAQEMIVEIRELELLRGFRNLPLGDCEALAAAICALSLLAHIGSRTVADAEINPLIVKAQGRGVVAVDGLVILK